jgi:glycosyltransferase involved in cell wall biosynthesis
VKADVFHFEWEYIAAKLLPVFELWKRPVVVSCRGSAVLVRPHTPRGERERLKELLPSVFARAAAVHCVSESIRQDAERFGLERAKTWVIRSGVDSSFFRPSPHRRDGADGFRIASVGTLRWVKGFEYSLMALARLARDGCPAVLEIAGAEPVVSETAVPSDLERLRAAAEALDLDGRVWLRGGVSPAEVRRMMQRSDVLLQGSLSEGLPNAVLEAMACGLPVVATDVGGTSEAVRDGVEGFLVPARDAEAIATALAKLWRDPALRARMGVAGRARVEAEFTLERETREWMGFYASLAPSGGRQR